MRNEKGHALAMYRLQRSYDDFYLASKEETQEQINGAEKFTKAVASYLDSVDE